MIMADKKEAKSVKEVRSTLRLTPEDSERLKYWADREDLSLSAFVLLMLDQWVDIHNGNYQLPTLEVQRLNQLIDIQTVLSKNIQSLETIVISGFDSLLSLTKGDNYLLEEEDGELR